MNILRLPIDKITGYIIYLIGTSWAIDGAGFFGNKLYGGTFKYLQKLNNYTIKKISPNKTIEGVIFSLISGTICFPLFSIIIGPVLLSSTSFPVVDFYQSIIFGIVISVFDVVGDLFESQFKRSHMCKDSGVLFPGHGGALDRLDSILFIAPPMYYLMILFFSL
jgi:phosphatidate cytidylyltransferase